MADAGTRTRAHVGGTPAAPLIPVANLEIPTPDTSDTDSAIGFTPPSSRKEKRKQRKLRHDSCLPTPTDTDTEAPSAPRTPPNNPPKKIHKKPAPDASIPPSMPLAKNAAQTAYPLLICSIGNPGATYAKTLHSAGHVLTSYLAERKNYQPFCKGLSGLVSTPDIKTTSFSVLRGYTRVNEPLTADQDWTFWQSTSLMNVSGASVKRAYTEWLRARPGSEGRLVVVHDELEAALGKVTVRDGGASAKGHNGLKSCQQSLGGIKWRRIGVGIGRPESRDPSVVSRYVLGKMSKVEEKAIEKSAVPVFKALEDIAEGSK